jgi:hypothetical protein
VNVYEVKLVMTFEAETQAEAVERALELMTDRHVEDGLVVTLLEEVND